MGYWVCGGDFDCGVEVVGVDYVEFGDLFVVFGEWFVGYDLFVGLDVYGCGVFDRL